VEEIYEWRMPIPYIIPYPLIRDAMALDLLVFGDTAIDNFYEVDTIPKADGAGEVGRAQRFYGGMGANTAVVAAKLGLKVGLVSVIGTDADDYRKYMEGQGIKLYLKAIFGDTTKSMFFKSPKEQVSYFYKGVNDFLYDLDPVEEFGKTLEKNVKATYMARTYLQMQKHAIELYPNTLRVFNPGYGTFKFDKIPRIFRKVMTGSDTVILNHHELQHLKKAGFKMKSKTKQTYITTLGASGARVHLKNTYLDIPTYKTNAVDASGAGDAFNAGYIAARLRGYDIYDAVKLANAVASYIVESWGCQTNLPDWDQAIDRYENIR
jgi:ribokinase